MRKAVSKLHWQGIGVLVALALALGILAPLPLYGSVRADAPVFNVYADVESIDDLTAGATSDIHNVFGVKKDDPEPWPNLMYDVQVSFQPPEWGVARGEDVPIGAQVAQLDVQTTLGLIDNPCNTGIQPAFELMNCTLDKSETVTYEQQFQDVNANGIADGCDKWPEFLDELFPGMTPVARMAGFASYSGTTISMNFLVFEPGTSLPARFQAPPFLPEKGYVAISVLQDPTAPSVPDKITDQCQPLSSNMHYFGVTKDNPRTGVDESGLAWRTNPCTPGHYTFYGFAASIRDADADNIDNSLDTCPHAYDPACDPTDYAYPSDVDADGLCDVCDPTPNTAGRNPDGDLFKNFQDNCPLVANNDQLDSDLDRIGDACDQDDWNGDGDTDDHDPANPPTPPDYLDPGEPTGFSPTTPDGQRAEVWFASDWEITGEPCLTPTPPSVGGMADLPGVSNSGPPNRIALAGLAAAALAALTAGAWYARRRWIR
jgi:hypothetical protein